VADVEWARYSGVELQPQWNWIALTGTEDRYRPVPDRRRIAREYLELADAAAVKAFVERWGPPFVDTDPWPGHQGPFGVAVEAETSWAAEFRTLRVAGLGGDEAARTKAEHDLVDLVRAGMGLDFAPGGGLVPQLVPRQLRDLVTLALLEELRAVGPVLQCLNYPSPGCLRDVPERSGDRGRRPLYCSPRCAGRAQSRRSYARRRAAKESQS
jgi:hypothetical protein